MPYIAAKVELSDNIREILNGIAKSKTLPACQIQRANIILLASKGRNNMEIARETRLGQDSVSKWRTRFVKCLPHLQEVEAKELSKLKNEVILFLKDAPRPGKPRTYTDEQVIKIIDMACHSPTEYGIEASHWSLNQLKNVAIREGIVAEISAKTISRFLKYGESPPASRSLLASFIRKIGKPRILYREDE